MPRLTRYIFKKFIDSNKFYLLFNCTRRRFRCYLVKDVGTMGKDMFI